MGPTTTTLVRAFKAAVGFCSRQLEKQVFHIMHITVLYMVRDGAHWAVYKRPRTFKPVHMACCPSLAVLDRYGGGRWSARMVGAVWHMPALTASHKRARHAGLATYANYMFGGGYVVSADVAKALVTLESMVKLKFTPIEDATVGFWLMGMDIRQIDHKK